MRKIDCGGIMKNFEEIKQNIEKDQLKLMQRAMEKKQNGNLRSFEENAMDSIIRDCQNNLENLDEAAVINIGAQTNSLIQAIRTAYQFYLQDYYRDFPKFMNDYVAGLTPDGEFKNGAFFGKSQCVELGIGYNDLLCFKGQNPLSADAGDLFRQYVNANLGTTIPTEAESQQALKDYEAVMFSNDKVAAAKALKHLKEIQRDAGILKNGGSYNLLANDQHYQNAVNISSGKTL